MTEHTDGMDALTVGQVAEKYGLTVRTLHHYDTIGLLVPSERTAAGYRLYTPADLSRLSTVVTYRRLGFSLDEVADLLEGEEPVEVHLRRQRAAVETRLGELHQLVAAIDQALEHQMNDQPLTDAELRELFGDGFDDSYAAEAEQRWGDTPAWEQSRRRTSSYGREQWEQIKAEAEEVTLAFVDAMRAGEPADSEAARAAAQGHLEHIHRWFYDLDHEFQRNLADMYVADPRFTKTYDDIEPGLAAYVRDAIHANANRRD